MTDTHIREFLERYGRAVSAGDLQKIAACWEVPALVLGDQEAVAVGGLGRLRPSSAARSKRIGPRDYSRRRRNWSRLTSSASA
jgi:hypothetical protein